MTDSNELHAKSQFEFSGSLDDSKVSNQSRLEPKPTSEFHSWWHHLCGILFVAACAVFAGIWFYKDHDTVLLISIGVVSGYYTLICSWMVFGVKITRLVLGPVFWGLLFLSQIIFVAGGSGPAESTVVQAFFATNVGFIAFKLGSAFLLKWWSRLNIRHKGELEADESTRINYGLAEIMFATTIVAVMAAMVKTFNQHQPARGDFGHVILVLTCIGICHFIIFWPLLFAAFVERMRVSLIFVSILVFSLTVYAQIPFFDAVLDIPQLTFTDLMLLDLTFALTVAVHFAIANLNGYLLVQKVRSSRL